MSSEATLRALIVKWRNSAAESRKQFADNQAKIQRGETISITVTNEFKPAEEVFADELETTLATPSATQGVAFDAQMAEKFLQRHYNVALAMGDTREPERVHISGWLNLISMAKELSEIAAAQASATMGQVSEKQISKAYWDAMPSYDTPLSQRGDFWKKVAANLNALLRPSAPPSAPAKQTQQKPNDKS